MSRKLYGYITNDEKPEFTQNWDGKGNIYYTDSDGNLVDFNVNPLTKIKNNISAFGENFDRWLNRSDYDKDVQRQKRNIILGLETAPIGASEAVAGKLAGQLVPFLGKKVADYVAKGSLSGGLGNAAYEGLEAAFDNKNPLAEGLKGFGSGLIGGGAFGLGLGKLNKFIDRRNILKNNVQERLQQYWDDYIEGLSDNAKLDKQSLQSKEVADFRGLRQGIDGGESAGAFDIDNINNDSFSVDFSNNNKIKSKWSGITDKGNLKKSKSRYYPQKYQNEEFEIRVSDHNKALKGSGKWSDDSYTVIDFNGTPIKFDNDFMGGYALDADIVVNNIGDFNKNKKEIQQFINKKVIDTYEKWKLEYPNLYK